MTEKKQDIAKREIMKIITLILALYSSAVLADDSKFALICEWTNGQIGGSQTYHVDLTNGTVDGNKAKITGATISFVKDGFEYTIDRVSGVLKSKELNSTRLQLAGAINRCNKVPDIPKF